MQEMNDELVQSVLKLARNYPSGDNSQPFRFRLLKKDRVLLMDYKAKEAKHTLVYDVSTLLMTFGFALEYLRNSFAINNATVEFHINLEDFNVANDHMGICSIKCVDSVTSPRVTVTQEVLLKRVSDRRPFQPADTIDIDIESINSSLGFSNCQLHVDAEPEILDFFALCDSLVWQSKTLGMDIMSAVTFTTPPASTGLPWRNLGLKKAETFPIRLLQKYRWLFNVFKSIGAGEAMRRSQRLLWGSSSSFLVFSYDKGLNNNEKTLANMELMNVLLKLSEQGYNFQPSTMSSEVLNYPVKPDTNLQTAANLDLDSISELITDTREKLQLGDKQVNWLLRCGKQVEPFPENARTLRHHVNELLVVVD